MLKILQLARGKAAIITIIILLIADILRVLFCAKFFPWIVPFSPQKHSMSMYYYNPQITGEDI